MAPMNERWPESEKFVGRAKELAEFDRILGHPREKERTLLLQAVGGQGKTWLIKMMLLRAVDQPNILALKPDRLVDMYSTSNRHLEGVLAALAERIVEELGTAEPFQPYYAASKELEKAREQEEYSVEDLSRKVKDLAYETFRNCLQTVTQERVVVLAFDTFENVHGTEVSDWILSDSGLQMPNLICLIGTRASLTDEQKLDYPSVRQIQLGGLSDEEAIKLFISYTGEKEEAVDADRKAFIRALNEKSARNPLMLGLAIIYLDLEDNKAETLRLLAQAEFEKEVVAWLSPTIGPSSISIGSFEYSEEMRQALVLMAYLNRRFNKFFLQKLVDAGYIHLDNATVDELWNELDHKKPDLFFVKERPDGEIQLHDKLAELLRKFVLADAFRDRTGEILCRFVSGVVDWYKDLIQTSSTSQELLYAEQLAYLLRADLYADWQSQPLIESTRLSNLAPEPEEIVAVLEGHFHRHSDVLARLLINEAKIPLIEQFGGEEERYKIYTTLGQIAEQCYAHEAAQAYLQKAYEVAATQQDCDKQAVALLNLHNSTFPVDPQKSLRILEDAETVCAEKTAEKWLPKVFYERGFTYSLLNKLPDSNSWFEKARNEAGRLQDEEMMPIILNDWGYNFLLAGDVPKGRISIRAARDIRYRRYTELSKKFNTKLPPQEKEELTEELQNAQKMLGLSYSTLGELARFSGRLEEAIARYTEALDIFRKGGSHYWQARMYFTRGETYRRIAAEDFRAGRSGKSRRMDKQAEDDISRGVALCKQYGFRKDSATAYRRLGRLYHDRMFRISKPESQFMLLEAAKGLFKTALSVAEEANDYIEIFENLTELAFLADDYLDLIRVYKLAEFDEAKNAAYADIQILKDRLDKYTHETENPIYFLPVFEHLLEIEQAAYFFALREYEQALPLYINGYVGMAQNRGYGVARYLQHIDHLINQLRELSGQDKELAKNWCNEILAAWENAGLIEKRIELPQEIEMFMNTLFLYKNTTQ